MRGYFEHGFCCGFGPFGFHVRAPWRGGFWGFGFPPHEDYVHMLEDYKAEIEGMQRQIAEELKRVQQEIEKLRQT